MNQSLRHRGPDDEGYYQDTQASFAMRRLSIIDVAGGRVNVKFSANAAHRVPGLGCMGGLWVDFTRIRGRVPCRHKGLTRHAMVNRHYVKVKTLARENRYNRRGWTDRLRSRL